MDGTLGFILAISLLILLFYGDPDLYDAIRTWQDYVNSGGLYK